MRDLEKRINKALHATGSTRKRGKKTKLKRPRFGPASLIFNQTEIGLWDGCLLNKGMALDAKRGYHPVLHAPWWRIFESGGKCSAIAGEGGRSQVRRLGSYPDLNAAEMACKKAAAKRFRIK